MLTGLQKIKSILDNISKTDLPLTFKYLESQPSQFPVGCVLSLGFTEEPYDSAHNEVTEQFVINLIYPQEDGEVGYEKWLALSDLLADELRKKTHVTVGDQAVSIQIKQGLAPEYTDKYSQLAVVFGIVVEIKILKSINL